MCVAILSDDVVINSDCRQCRAASGSYYGLLIGCVSVVKFSGNNISTFMNKSGIFITIVQMHPDICDFLKCGSGNVRGQV